MANKVLKSLTFPGLNDVYKIPQEADEYSVSATYAVGDYCIKDGVLYRCTTAITTAEAWTAGHWTATQLADEVTSQSEKIDEVTYNLVYNLFNPNTITTGKYKKAADGTIGTVASWFYSDLIPVKVGVEYFIIGQNTAQIAFYSGVDVSTFVTGSGVAYADSYDHTVIAPSGAVYMTISMATELAPELKVYGREYLPELDGTVIDYISGIRSMLPVNYFNKNTITTGKYKKAANGTIGNASSWFFSDLMPVAYGDDLILNKSNDYQIAFYTNEEVTSFVSGLLPAQAANYHIVVPNTAKYMTISGAAADVNKIIITKGFSTAVSPENSLVSFLDKRYMVEGLVLEVGASGYDYTSILEAVEYIRGNSIENATVLVHAGEYDLISELVALKGQTFIDNYSSSEYSSPTGLKGLFLGNGIKIIGENPASTKIVCRYTGQNNSFKNDWSVFHVYNNEFKLSGFTITANNIRYCLHDDGRVSFGNDVGIIENCTFINEAINYGALIGAGLWGYSTRYIRDCQFINNQESAKDAISYHPNTDSNACEIHISNIYCKDCGVQAILAPDFDSLGTSTMYISNSYLNAEPYYVNPTAQYKRIVIKSWNNEIAST